VSTRSGRRARATPVTRLVIVALLGAGPQVAAAQAKAGYELSPYLAAKASEGAQSVDVGLQVAPASGFGFARRLAVTVGKPDDSLPAAELSTERPGLGLRVQLLWESPTRVPKAEVERGLSRFGAGLDGRWSVAKYVWNPDAGAERSTFEHTFKLELRAWWFGTTKAAAKPGTPGEVQSGTPPPSLTSTSYDVTVLQPQLRASFTRGWSEAEESFVVRAPPAAGPKLAEKLKLAGPSAAPTFSVLVAMAFALPGAGRFAAAPAVRFTTRGVGAREWDPTGKASRVRVELWGYLFAFGDETVRVGAAPFLDARTSGKDGREPLVAGGVVELRTGTSRLEY
jgi:hypothetical protein